MNKRLVNFVSLWVINLIVLLIVNLIFGQMVSFGNDKLPYPAAILVTTFLLTGLLYLVEPALNKANIKVKKEIQMAAIFLIANIVILWVLKRLAFLTGFGVSSILVVVILAVILSLAQWVLTKVTGSMAAKK